jgi:hypothetical protein
VTVVKEVDIHSRCFGRKAIEVSSHTPQLPPPPASGERIRPQAGIGLIQQSGRSRLQELALSCSKSHSVTLPARYLSKTACAAVLNARDEGAQQPLAHTPPMSPIGFGQMGHKHPKSLLLLALT